MKKYLQILKITWQEYFLYRLNFVMWRVRAVFQLLTVYFLWGAILTGRGEIFGWSQSLILTYILGTSLLRSLVLATRTYDVAEEINQGNLSNFLLRPINYFRYWFARDLADKIFNLSFALLELTVLFFLLRPPIFWQTNPWILLIFILAITLGAFLYFLTSFSLSLLAFWTPDVWAPRFLFLIFLEFFAGALFPLDILPRPLFSVLQFLPFSYFLYFPLKIYLGKLFGWQIILGFILGIFWLVLIFQMLQLIWRQGLKIYGAWGR